jgi:putative salt-induced outer membrane protein YdiY
MLTVVALMALSSADARTEALVETVAPGFVLAKEDPPAPPPKGWTGSVAVSASKATGNTDKTTAGATGQAERRGDDDRWTVQLVWNYSDEKGIGVTQRRTYGQVKYDRFFDKKRYGYGVVSAENDFNAALDLRTTVGVGLGYQFREDEEWKLSGEAGLSYVDENFETSSDDQDYLAARLAYKADWKIDEKWSVGQWTEVFPSLEDRDDVSARVDTHAKLVLTEKMFAQLQHIYTWDNTPATGADRVDELWLLSLGWSF